MPKFTLIKQAEGRDDTTVSVEFETEYLEKAREHVDSFLRASGFEFPEIDESLLIASFADCNGDSFSDKTTLIPSVNGNSLVQPVHDS